MRAGLVPLAAAALVLPLVLGAGAPNSDRDANRQRIADMTAAERERLEAKYQEYLSLSENEREQLRSLHADLMAHPELRAELEQYRQWLKTLSPWQRKELESETDWSKRLELVRRLREEQKAESEQRRDRDREAYVRPLVDRTRYSGPYLKTDDLVAVMQVLEENLPADPQVRQRIESAEGVHRWIAILTETLRQAGGDNPSRSNLVWPETAQLDRILDAIQSEPPRLGSESGPRRPTMDFKRSIEEARKDRGDEHAARMLLLGLLGKIQFKAWWEFSRLRPSAEEKARIYDELTPDLQSELQNMSGPGREGRLTWFYQMRRLRDEYGSELDELRNLAARFLGPFGRPTRRDGRLDGHRPGGFAPRRGEGRD
ncbi:MAG: hypothetical protein KY476_14940 [Planctomycetes bacterium]|nr:hypothetical protein [Planctomycetota bacterium]